MKDSLFACYDPLVCPNTIQAPSLYFGGPVIPTDRSSTQSLQQQQQQQQHKQPQQQQQFQLMQNSDVVSHSTNGVNHTDGPNQGLNNAATFSNTHNNIPFVQIHTTNVQPQRNNFGNVFRRTITNHAEIKSEPIKSENSDTSKDRVNGTPTPPVRNSSCNSSDRIATPANTQHENVTNHQPEGSANHTHVCQEELPNNSNGLMSLSEAYQAVRKCSQCRFLCLSDLSLEEHILATHATNNSLYNLPLSSDDRKISCPGCLNIFYSFKSLEIHLVEDHFTSLTDAKKLLEAVETVQRNSLNSLCTIESAKPLESTPPPVPPPPTAPGQQRKSRIYLKNVECLREPRREVVDMDVPHGGHVTDGYFQMNSFNNMERNVDLSELLFYDFTDMNGQTHDEKQLPVEHVNPIANNTDSIAQSKPKQKISIKSVDVLREPALVRRDFEMQNQFGNQNVCQDMDYENFGGFQNQPNTDLIGGTDDSTADHANNSNEDDANKPRRPKIYIKNVDILKEPIALPFFAPNGNAMGLQDPNPGLGYNFLQTQNTTDYMNSANNLAVANQVFDAEVISQLPLGGNNLTEGYFFDNPGNASGHINSNNNKNNNMLNDMNSMNCSESFQGTFNSGVGVGVGVGSNNIASNFLSYPIIDCGDVDSSTHTSSTTPIITEPTPPPPPTTVFNMDNVTETLGNLCEPGAGPPDVPPSQPKQKIFIKNVDILKEPQFQEQRERGTLHLRTVDELNLMNQNEVQDLIAPNLENNNNNNNSSGSSNCTLGMDQDSHKDYENSEENTKLTDEELIVHDENMFYEDETLKLSECETQLVNSWNVDDYDLGEDIDCIITNSIEPISNLPPTTLSPGGNAAAAGSTTNLQKIIRELETPQMSLISIRDIDELTGQTQQQQQQQQHQPSSDNNGLISLEREEMTDIMDNEGAKPCINCVMPMDSSCPLNEKDHNHGMRKNSNNLIVMPTGSNTTNPLVPTAVAATSFNFNLPVELPPLAPVTNFTAHNTNNKATIRDSNYTTSVGSSSLPVPPLVPVSTLVPYTTTTSSLKPNNPTVASTMTISTNTTTTTNSTTTTAPVERGRIYVANNLMENPSPKKTTTTSSSAKSAAAPSVLGGTSIRGRPFGSNRSDSAAKLNKPRPDSSEVVVKCSVRGCAFRFKKVETLAYHKKCHSSTSASAQDKICPECKSTDFGNWNTLHTHLWRTHQIDMELYSCNLCPFKTPIYSRLVNTHTKIHSEERNYKCEQCGKAFKNTKQLKNHRRWHRTHGNAQSSSTTTATNATDESNKSPSDLACNLERSDLHRCHDCGAAFSHLKTLREHSCKNNDSQSAAKCSVCGHVASSKSSLKLHMFTHENVKRLKCSHCTYSTNDHNAFRRHKMTHENTKMYTCPHCNYKSIQSAAFQKHVLLKHPDSASTLIYKCKQCLYSTVSRTLFAVHQIKHKSPTATQLAAEINSPTIETESNTNSTSIDLINIDSLSSNESNNQNHEEISSIKQKRNSRDNSSLPMHKKIKVKSDLLVTETKGKEGAQISKEFSKISTGMT